jgi:hypothetical protein
VIATDGAATLWDFGMAHGSGWGSRRCSVGVPIVVSTVGTSLRAAVGPSVGARVSPEISSTVGPVTAPVGPTDGA